VSPSNPNLDLDSKILSKAIYAFNIARRQINAYPAGHPVVLTSAKNLLASLIELLEFKDEVTIGIARDTLIVSGHDLDNNDPVYSDLAGSFSRANVASLTINKELTENDICSFFSMLSKHTTQGKEHGNFVEELRNSGLKGINAKGVDFSVFHSKEVDNLKPMKAHLVEDESTALWKSFIDGLVHNTLDPNGVKSSPIVTDVDPDTLAEILNGTSSELQGETIGSYEKAITTFLRHSDENQTGPNVSEDDVGRLGEVVARLNPELRRRFLNSTLTACTQNYNAETLLSNMPQSVILDAIEQIDSGLMEVPQSLIDILGKLAIHRDDHVMESKVSGTKLRTTEKTAQELAVLFKSHDNQLFVPEDYQDALSVLAVAESNFSCNQEYASELMTEMGSHEIEQQFSAVLLDLPEKGVSQETLEKISRNLESLIEYFLECGDFASLIKVHDRLNYLVGISNVEGDTPEKVALKTYSDPFFIEQILEGLEEWGKTAYPLIKELIKRVGKPFANHLLECLAVEPELSRRKLYMECLNELGTEAVNDIIKRLSDNRWFFVRNLVILLGRRNDTSVLKSIGFLVGHAHPKVRSEVLKIFLKHKDPRADRYLIRGLESDSTEDILNAVSLASLSHSEEVFCKLAKLLNRKALGEKDFTIKSTVISTLQKVAHKNTLPEISRFLKSGNLLKSAKITELKIKAVSSLVNYKELVAAEIADEVSRNATGELARVATSVHQQLKGKMP
jgi:hypothetical protein